MQKDLQSPLWDKEQNFGTVGCVDERSRDEKFFSIVSGLDGQLDWTGGLEPPERDVRERGLFVCGVLLSLTASALFFIDGRPISLLTDASPRGSFFLAAWHAFTCYPLLSVVCILSIVTWAKFINSVRERSRD